MHREESKRFSLKGKVVLLTGGNGIYGRWLTADLAAAGANLVIASRDRLSSERVAEEERACGHVVEAEALDQGLEESIRSLCDRLQSRWGRIDGLVNNAVLRTMAGPYGATAEFEKSMRVNATGLFLMHRYFGEIMKRQGGGSIVNVGSIQGNVGMALPLYPEGMKLPPPDYFFHKGGMLNLTRYYAGLLGPHQVRVNYLAPGGFQTNQPAEFIRRYAEQTMLGRMARREDLGGAVIFLLSDASAYITGVPLPVDGGYTAR